MDGDLQRVLLIIHELSEQIAHNHKLTSAIASQAGAVQGQTKHIGNGFALRRFSVDLSQESFESELERTNAQTIIDNQTLMHENKQLSLLLKEYEGTMGNILDKFHNHAIAAQQHETTLQRHYETLLYTRETQSLASDLSSSSELARTVHRLCIHLRNLLRSMAGESDEEEVEDEYEDEYNGRMRQYEHEPVDMDELMELLDELDSQTQEYIDNNTSSSSLIRQDWSQERELEIARLEAENAALRVHLGIDPQTIQQSGVDMQAELARMTAPRNIELLHRSGGGAGSSSSSAASNRSRGGSGSPIPGPSFWDGGGPGQQQQQQQSPFMPQGGGQQQGQQQQQQSRQVDFTNGMRMMQGMQGRRAGIFGQRGAGPGNGGSGRGVPIPLTPPSTSISLWNQPQTERGGWQQQQQHGSGLDMTR